MSGESLIVKLAAVGAGAILIGWLVVRAQKATVATVEQAWDGLVGGVSSASEFVGRHAATTLNPASTENAVYRGVNTVIGGLTGDPNFNLGSRAYDWLNPPPAPDPGRNGVMWLDLPDLDALPPLLNPPPYAYTDQGLPIW